MPALQSPEIATGDGNATRCLEIDHGNLDALLFDVEEAAGGGRFAEASKQFGRFAAGLLRHIEAEERVLFPQLLHSEPRAAGPVSVMRFEHQEFRDLLDLIASQLASSAKHWRDALWRLKQVLVAHNTKEERMLYPMADEAALVEGRSSELAETLRAALKEPS